jgi:hypothetical protein
LRTVRIVVMVYSSFDIYEMGASQRISSEDCIQSKLS